LLWPQGVVLCMSKDQGKLWLDLMGPFRLRDAQGRRIEVASKRGQALIATLATSRSGDRTRVWLQERLWGSRQLMQAQASLRRELSNLRQILNGPDNAVIGADYNRVWIDLERVQVGDLSSRSSGEFLEGLDIKGEEAFEDWLREQRHSMEVEADRDSLGKIRLPDHIIDLKGPVPGFADRPAIAILPLNNISGDDTLSYLADGISEELSEMLARLKWLPVIARSASFLYRGRAFDLRQIGAALGARYVVEGSLRRSGEMLRLGLQMADVETSLSVWSHTSDIPMTFTQKMLDDLICEIVGVVDTRIDAVEKMRASTKTLDPMDVNDLIWRGRWHLHRFTREDSELAEQCFQQALALSPNSAEALIQLTFFHARSVWVERKEEHRMHELRDLARRAILADGADGRGYMYAGMAELWMRQTERALSLFKKAVDLNPSLSLAHAQIGSAHILAGEPAAAEAPLKLALRLGPNDEHSFYVLGELAIAHCMMGQWDRAIEHAEQSLLRRSAYWYAHVIKINSLVNKGALEEAKLVSQQLLQVKPNFSSRFVEWLPFANRKWNNFLRAGVARVGLD